MSSYTPSLDYQVQAPYGSLCHTVTSRPAQKLRLIGTQVVCTLGPATRTVAAISELIEAGANVFRLNFSHGTHDQHAETLANLREAAKQLHSPVAVLQDLCGPKIRVSRVRGGQALELRAGDRITITADPWFDAAVATTSGRAMPETCDLATNYEAILSDVQIGENVLINDGKQRLKVVGKHARCLECQVLHGGTVTIGKGINLPQAQLSTPSVTEKDWEDLKWGLEHGVDFVALSFVRTAADIIRVRDHLERVGSPIQIIAKIERPEALANLEEILNWTDGIMVARGDLAIETDCARVPLVQKHLIERCRELHKPVITATQLLDSMVDSPMPTRAEVSDVANAVLDGTDALMLSNETAVGKHPTLAVDTLMKVSQATIPLAHRRFAEELDRSDTRMAAMTSSAAALADRCGAKAIAIYTQSGFGARHLSSMRLPYPVVACTNSELTHRQLTLSYGVTPLMLDAFMDRAAMIPHVLQIGIHQHWWQDGDRVVFLGSNDGCGGELNMIQVITVET